MTVREDTEYGPAQLGMAQSAANRRVEQLADELGLNGLLDELFGAADVHYRDRIRQLVTDHDGTVLLFTPSLDVVYPRDFGPSGQPEFTCFCPAVWNPPDSRGCTTIFPDRAGVAPSVSPENTPVPIQQGCSVSLPQFESNESHHF